MTRISTFSQGQALVTQMLRNQEYLRHEQTRVATGKNGDNLKDIARDANVLLSSRSVSARTESYMSANRELAVRMELQNNALGGIAGIADEFRNDLIKTVNLNSGVGLIDKMTDHMDRLVNLLNTTLNGKYIFSGSRTDVSPINVSTTADLLALANTSDSRQFFKELQKAGYATDPRYADKLTSVLEGKDMQRALQQLKDSGQRSL